jgi:hypothetical protein
VRARAPLLGVGYTVEKKHAKLFIVTIKYEKFSPSDGAPTASAADDELVRQPSEGYQVLDENHRDDGSEMSPQRRRHHQDSTGDLTSSTGHSLSSDSGDSSSECGKHWID